MLADLDRNDGIEALAGCEQHLRRARAGEIANTSVARICRRYRGLRVVGCRDGVSQRGERRDEIAHAAAIVEHAAPAGEERFQQPSDAFAKLPSEIILGEMRLPPPVAVNKLVGPFEWFVAGCDGHPDTLGLTPFPTTPLPPSRTW